MSKNESIVIRFGASNCDLTVNGETVDLSSAFGFKSVGTGKNAVHGLLRPSKDNDRASSMVIAHLQRRGMFTKEVVS